MTEQGKFVPEEWQITLVSGMGNDRFDVLEPQEQAAIAWRRQGLQVVMINPNYEGSLEEIMAELKAARGTAEEQGLKMLSVGSGEGGTLTSLERVIFALEKGKVGDKGVTICSRMDLLNYGGQYPTSRNIRDRSPLVADTAETLANSAALVKLTPGNSLNFTAGELDEEIPPNSSVLPGARAVLLRAPFSGRPLTHATAIKSALLDPRHRDRMLSLAGYTPNKRPLDRVCS